MTQAVYELWFSFFLYAFLGWCGEVCFSAITRRIFVNCGVLSGPICPIYGVGACLVIACLNPLRSQPILLFVGAVLLASVLEFVTGFLLERIFHTKWWDYTGKLGNLCGYICLPMSLLWGIACLIVVYGVQSFAMWSWSFVPPAVGWSILGLLTALLLVDLWVTTGNLVRLRHLMRVAEDLKAAMLKVSDTLGDRLAHAVFAGMETRETGAEKLASLKAKLDDSMKEKELLHITELAERYRRLRERRADRPGRRLLKAFPRLKEHALFHSVEQWLQHRQKKREEK